MSHRAEHLLIDGYNLIKASAHFGQYQRSSLERARRALEQALARYARHTGARITLFFDGDDGPQEAGSRGPVQVIFSRPPRQADDLIKEAIQQRHGAKYLRVISTDREIRRFAERHRVRATPSGEFEQELEAPPRAGPAPDNPEAERETVLSEEQLAEWERIFREGRR